MFKPVIIFILLFISAISLHAQDSSFIQLNKTHFNPQDTISINCNLANYKTDSIHFATLNVWIENIDNGNKLWKFRYPLINGAFNGSIIIDSSIANGQYALNFVVEKRFFSLEGEITNYPQGTKGINYVMITKNGNTITNNFYPTADSWFKLKGILFEDTAGFVFSPTFKNLENDLVINIKSPLDSFFNADTSFTQIISIGNETQWNEKPTDKASGYRFDYKNFYDKTTLPNVTVTTKQKKKVELFDEEYSSTLFKSFDAKIFDGIEDYRIAHSVNFIDFLIGRVVGLKIYSIGNNKYFIDWVRGPSYIPYPAVARRDVSNVDIYVDEVKWDVSDAKYIDPGNIAMIKVYPPPAFLSGGGGNAAIAVYTKRGEYLMSSKGNYSFKVFGYSPPETVWKGK